MYERKSYWDLKLFKNVISLTCFQHHVNWHQTLFEIRLVNRHALITKTASSFICNYKHEAKVKMLNITRSQLLHWCVFCKTPSSYANRTQFPCRPWPLTPLWMPGGKRTVSLRPINEESVRFKHLCFEFNWQRVKVSRYSKGVLVSDPEGDVPCRPSAQPGTREEEESGLVQTWFLLDGCRLESRWWQIFKGHQ